MKETTYNDAYLRMAILGDALSLKLPKKALSEVLRLRAHYGKAIREFDEIKKQIAEDAAKGKDPEKDKETIEAAAKEAITKKADEPAGIADRRLSAEAFEEVCGAAIEAGTITSAMFLGEDKKPVSVDATLWLEPIAYNLTD